MEAIFKLAAIYSVVDKLTGPVKKMSGSVINFEKMLNKANGMQNYGMKMGVGAAAIGVAADKMKSGILNIAEPYSKIEDATAQLQTVTTSTMGSMQKSLKATQQAAINWSKSHTDSAESYLQATTKMASAGLNDIQAIAGTSSALALAKANMGEAGSAAELLSQIYNNMGDKTRDANQEMTHLSDVMTKTMQLYQVKNLGALGEGLAAAMSSAKNYKVSVEELNMVIGQLNNLGITGSSAGTAFSATLRQMNKASQELGFSIARTADGGINLTDTIVNIKNKYGDFSSMTQEQQMAFQSAFGDEGLRAVGLLMDQTDGMKSALQEVTGATGETAKALAILEDTGSARMQVAMNNLEAMKIQFGEKILGNKTLMEEILPGIMNNVEWIGNLATSFMELHPQMTQNIVLFTVLGAVALGAIAPVIAIIGGVLTLAGSGLGAIVKIGQGTKWFFNLLRSEAVIAYLLNLKIKLISAFMSGRAAAVRCAASMQTFILSMWRASAAAAMAGAQGLKQMTIGLAMMARQAIMTAVTAIPAMIAAVWSFTVALLANPITWIVLGIAALALAIYYCAKNWDIISLAAQNAWNVIVEAFQSGLSCIQEGINGALMWIDNMMTTFFNSGAALWEAFTGGIRSALSGPAEAVQEGLQWIRNMLPFSDAKEGPLSQLTHNGKKLMSTIAEGVTIEAPKLHDAVGDGLDIDDLFQKPPKGGSGGSGKSIVFQGPITIQVENMNKPDDFFGALKQFADEVGG